MCGCGLRSTFSCNYKTTEHRAATNDDYYGGIEANAAALEACYVLYGTESSRGGGGWLVANRKAQTVVELGTACSQHGK